MRRGDLPAARAAFEKAVRLKPQNPDAQNMLGQVLLQQGDLDDAITHFRALVRLRPKLGYRPRLSSAGFASQGTAG